ncbi:CRISPR-associated endoribonuclease Cas6 C-terminal domain-containing protein [Desulfonema limicola]|uniref:CRISPR-associated endoribonuclease Cas6 C-terminal domain-containing protein n=1 Tax=Desulfonema limicola TaxID=45656 RepID=A0A975B7J9_9BACT|nr:CRISPR system precrRNA processing endoribonuclease RAMP protein Cas6 [Desulfonema limicola]QTA80244.1 CRISPR-associated endoribonuclease Cas6 C-terminal domain-containing protein [Desulfonema limicola]
MRWGKYEFICSFNNHAMLPKYKGSTFRGVFGHALKKVVCALKNQECINCMLRTQCIYPLVFETPTVRSPPENSNISAVPHPFVIEPPMTLQTEFYKNDSFNFNLLLFGDMNNNLPYFIYAFDQMGKAGVGTKINGSRGSFSLNKVIYMDKTIYSDMEKKLAMTQPLENLWKHYSENLYNQVSRIQLTLETPLRFKRNNRLSDELPFHVLVRLMLRRVSSLMTCYGSGEPLIDYKELVKKAEHVQVENSNFQWFDWQRYSTRQEQKMSMGGIAGTVIYKGELDEFMPLIDFCTKVHIGKQTTFGLGKVFVEMV